MAGRRSPYAWTRLHGNPHGEPGTEIRARVPNWEASRVGGFSPAQSKGLSCGETVPVLVRHFIVSMSGNFQFLSKNGFSGPYTRNHGKTRRRVVTRR